MALAVQEWLRVIPDFYVATDDELRSAAAAR
jgi:hypothetical protein